MTSELYRKLEEDKAFILTLWNDSNFLKNQTLVDYIIYPRILSIMEISGQLNDHTVYNEMYDFFVSESRKKKDRLRSECASEIWWVLLEANETEEKILDNFFNFSDRIQAYIIDSISVDCNPKYLFLINNLLEKDGQDRKKLLEIKTLMIQNSHKMN